MGLHGIQVKVSASFVWLAASASVQARKNTKTETRVNSGFHCPAAAYAGLSTAETVGFEPTCRD